MLTPDNSINSQMHKKEYAIIKLQRRQVARYFEVTGEVFESTASLLNKKVLSFIKQEEKQKKKKRGECG